MRRRPGSPTSAMRAARGPFAANGDTEVDAIAPENGCR
jgi:hypothetical protein